MAEKENLVRTIVDGGMTKYKLAKRMGVSWVTVQSWYVEKSFPQKRRALKLKDVLMERDVLGE